MTLRVPVGRAPSARARYAVVGLLVVLTAMVTMAFTVGGSDPSSPYDAVVAAASRPDADPADAPSPPHAAVSAAIAAEAAPDATPRAVETDTDPVADSGGTLVDTDGGSESQGPPEATADDAGPDGPVVDADFVPSFVVSDQRPYGSDVSRVESTPEPARTPTPAPARTPEPAPTPEATTPSEPRPGGTDASNADATDPDPSGPGVPEDAATEDDTAADGDEPDQSGASSSQDPTPAQWAALRACESGGNYSIDTGNGYFGAYQFSQATWDWVVAHVRPAAVGRKPSNAAPALQDSVALTLYRMRGTAPWPSCGDALS